MAIRIGCLTTITLLLAAGPVGAQIQPRQGPAANPRPAPGPNPPAAARPPAVQRRPAEPQQPQTPFQLTPHQEANLDWILNTWQERNAKTRTFECTFTRWEYDPVFGDPKKPSFVDEGKVKYRTPDKGMFHVEKPKERQERWISDGKSIFEYDFTNKQLVQHQLPPELHGKAIVESPLPFIFGAEAAKLKQRYFLRIITPPNVQGQQTWLEAYPRFQRDAANFKRAELILTNQTMAPHALQIYAPNGQNRTVYQFHDIVINDPLFFLKGNPFHPLTPPFWKKIFEPAPTQQVGRRPPPVGKR